MRRSIQGKVVVSVVVAVLMMPLSASAYLGENPITNAGMWNTLSGHLGFGADPTPPVGVTPPDSASATLLRARIALETMPNLSELGTLTLGTGPLQIRWRVNSSRFVTFDLDVGSSWVGTYVNGTKWGYNPGFASPEFAEALGLPPPSGGMTEPYWMLAPQNYLNNPNNGWYFECEPGIPWNSCQQWNGYNQDANTEWLQALRDTAEDVPMTIPVRDFYCNDPNTPERKCKGLFLTQEVMRSLISDVSNETYSGQSYSYSTSNFVPVTHSFGDAAATRARSELLADGDTALYIGDLLDQDWDGLDDATLLEMYTPQLRFPADEVYRPARADLSTDTYFTDDPAHANWLQDGYHMPIASADPNEIYEDTYHPDPIVLDDLSLPYLGDNLGNADYEINHANHLGNQEHSSADDYVRMLDEHPGEYNDVVYGRLETHPTSGEKIAEYWFYYYHNPKTWEGVGAHEGDWEWIQVRFNSTGIPSTVAYSRHGGGRRCLWSTVMKSNGTHPVVWPAKDSHANYFFPGEYALNFFPGVTVIDTTAPRGVYESLDPSLDDDALNESWVEWQGRWGGSGEGTIGGAGASPKSPGEQAPWEDPFSWHTAQPFGCVDDLSFRRDGTGAPEGHSTALFESSARPALPRVTAHLSSAKRRVIVDYCFKSMPRGRHVRPWRISVGLDNVRDALPPLMFGWPVKARCGKIKQTVGPADPPYRLLVRVTAASGARSRLLSMKLRS